ncbi:MAG TPA: hypothetical protein VFS43_43935 [Polyangiaceae bacterium]|nr:hypothetical protein [Polyangiaceae bacterium]
MTTTAEALTNVVGGPAPEPGPPEAPGRPAWPARPAPAGPPTARPAEGARGGGEGAAPGGSPPGRLGLLEALVREPDAFLQTAGREDGVALVRALVASVLVGAGVFGAVVGAFRGGAQVAYCAVKVPLALLATLVVCTPAFVAIARATGTRMGARDVVALTLGACARFSLVLACLAPVVWLLEDWCGYHRMVLLSFAACAVAGLAAGALLFRGLLRRPGSGRIAGLAFVAVFGLVGAQTSWLLRPYVVRPQTRQTPFVRQLEGDLPEAIWMSVRSALGVYDRPATGEAPGSSVDGERVRARPYRGEAE